MILLKKYLLLLVCLCSCATQSVAQTKFEDATHISLQTPLWAAKFQKNLQLGWTNFLTKNGEQVLSPHEGESALVMYVSQFNDPTQGYYLNSSKIDLLNKPSIPFSNFKEISCGSGCIRVTGSVAPFWISHEKNDDYVSSSDLPDWNTLYQDKLNWGGLRFIQFDTPIGFKATIPNKASHFFLGNEIAVNTPAYTNTKSFYGAAVISASSDFPKHPGNVASLVARNRGGNFVRFDINSNGQWGLLLDYQTLASGTYNAANLYNGTGVKLEFEAKEGRIKAIINNTQVADKLLAIQREDWMLGVGGRAIDSRGSLIFGYRRLLDLEEVVTNQVNVVPNGSLRSYTKLISRNKVRGTNFYTFFNHPEMSTSSVKVSRKDGTVYNTRAEFITGENGELIDLKDFYAAWVGNDSGTRGVFLHNVTTPNNLGHLLISPKAVAVNTSPREHFSTPNFLPNGNAEVFAEWLPEFNQALFTPPTPTPLPTTTPTEVPSASPTPTATTTSTPSSIPSNSPSPSPSPSGSSTSSASASPSVSSSPIPSYTPWNCKVECNCVAPVVGDTWTCNCNGNKCLPPVKIINVEYAS